MRLGRAVSPYIFTVGEEQIDESAVSHRFKEYARLAGPAEGIHFHRLRHTYASWLVQDGVSHYEVLKLLGHSNNSLTQVYSHLQPETLHSTVNKISLSLT